MMILPRLVLLTIALPVSFVHGCARDICLLRDEVFSGTHEVEPKRQPYVQQGMAVFPTHLYPSPRSFRN